MEPGRSLFSFAKEGRSLIDHGNGLRIRTYQWPEYDFTVSVEPLNGPQAEAWPLRERAYFEFGYAYPTEDGAKICTFSMAIAHQPFERDFPGRVEELLDTVIPLILPTSLFSFPHEECGQEARIPNRMRSLLETEGSYYRHRDEPGTDAYRQAHPGRNTGRQLRQFLRKLLS